MRWYSPRRLLIVALLGILFSSTSSSVSAHADLCAHYGHTHTYQGNNAEQWNYLGHTWINGQMHKHTFNHKIYTNGVVTHNETHTEYCSWSDPSHN